MFYLLAILLFLGALFSVVRKHRVGLVGCTVLLLLLTGSRSWFYPSGEELLDRFNLQNREVMAEVLADRIAERHPGKRVGLIGLAENRGLLGSFARNAAGNSLLFKALKKRGITTVQNAFLHPAGSIDKPEKVYVVGDDPAPEDYFPEEVGLVRMSMALSRVDARALNRMVEEMSDEVDVVVCTLPLTAGFKARQLLPRGRGPALVLVHVNVDDLEYAFRETVLDMHLGNRNDASWAVDYKWPKDDAEAFDYRYALTVAEKRPFPLEE